MLLSAKLLACRCGLHSLEGHSFGSIRAARLQGLTPKQESLGGKLIAEEARHCGREANRVSFQFSLQPPTNPDANAEAKLTSAVRSRKLALDIFLAS